MKERLIAWISFKFLCYGRHLVGVDISEILVILLMFSCYGINVFDLVNSGGSKGARGTRTPWRSKFFQIHAVFGKFWQNRMLSPPWRVGAPPRGNPGSTTG